MRGYKHISQLAAVACITLLAWAGLSTGCRKAETTDPKPSAPAGTAYQRGRQIVDEYLKRDAAPFRMSRIRFTITEQGEADKIYEIESWRKQTPAETTTLTQIVVPPEDDGTSTLTLEAKGKKTVVVTYAVSRNEFRETDTKKMFFGGLTVGELLGEWDKFDLRFVGEKDLDGVKVLEIDGTVKADTDSAVARINVLFRTDNYVPVEMHLFGADGREMRVYKTASITDDPEHPYAARMDVINAVYKNHIVIDVLSREYPETIDDSMFAREKLRQSVRK
jgi:hypothetical protein